MKGLSRGARTLAASGRFFWVAVLLSACQVVGGPGPIRTGDPAGLPPVVVEPGPISREDEAEANRLWFSAQRSNEARRFFEVTRTVETLLEQYPRSQVSGAALRLSASALLATGDSLAADEAAGRYIALLPPGDPRAAPMRLLQADARASEPSVRLDRLLRIDESATATEKARAAEQVRLLADSLQVDTLQAVVDSVESTGPLRSIAEARLSVALLEANQMVAARLYAQWALDHGAAGEDRTWAEGVLRGELPEGHERVTTFSIAALLPISGPPALAEYSSLIAEGIEVAAATVLQDPFQVTVVTADNEGDPAVSAERISELESEGVVGIVGLLQDDVLVSAGAARQSLIPLVSPTARSAARAGEAVYSLEGADPAAAASVARYAASRAFQRLAMVYPNTPDAEAEADAFAATARSLGMPVVARFPYEAGGTSFETQILGARNVLRRAEIDSLGLTEDDTLHVEELPPVALFMPIPAEDVEFLAPQVIHFGLDTLAIEILGTSGWTDPSTLSSVASRLTTGVVATAPVSEDSEGFRRFQLAYESHFQRTLVSATPALGYDATLILLEALRSGRVAPAALERSFSQLSDVQGATGLFSVVDGRIVRRTQVVRIENQQVVPVANADVTENR